MIGNLAPEALWDRPRPWHADPVGGASTEGPGEAPRRPVDLLRVARPRRLRPPRDLRRGFAAALGPALGGCAARTAASSALASAVAAGGEPLYSGGDRLGRRVRGGPRGGRVADRRRPAGELPPPRSPGALALRRLLAGGAGEPVDFLLGCGRGGGRRPLPARRRQPRQGHGRAGRGARSRRRRRQGVLRRAGPRPDRGGRPGPERRLPAGRGGGRRVAGQAGDEVPGTPERRLPAPRGRPGRRRDRRGARRRREPAAPAGPGRRPTGSATATPRTRWPRR